jgi:hypothetical protein
MEWVLVPLAALTIPIIAIITKHRQNIQSSRIRELELKKEMMELELKTQNSKIRLLEEENKNLDKIINN